MLRRIWLMLHEPRAVTATMIVAWSVCTGIGLAALVMPPASLAHHIGPLLTVIWAALLLAGGTLGGAGCAAGWWWAERSGILLAGTGLAVYLTVVLALDYPQPGSRLVQAGIVLLALGLLVTRWLRISGAQVDPTRGLPRVH